METIKRAVLPISLLDENEGQIEGLPTNPREITKENFELLKQNIEDYPELLDYNLLKVYPLDGRYVVIGGNMRLRALRECGCEEIPCCILDEGTDIDRLQAYTVLDNASFGRWDWEKLAKDWDGDMLPQWGLNLPTYEDSDLDGLFDVEEKEDTDKLTVVIPESLADMKKAIKEDVETLLSNYNGIKIQ